VKEKGERCGLGCLLLSGNGGQEGLMSAYADQVCGLEPGKDFREQHSSLSPVIEVS